MAEEKLQYVLTLATRATGTGVQETTAALEKLKAASADVNDKVRVSEWGFHDLDSKIQKTAATTETYTAGLTKLAPTTRNNAAALLMFSQGFEDAQYGMRGVLNNIPGLIMAMGGTAGLAGAISIAAVSLSAIIPLFQKTKEKAGETEKKISDMAEALGKVSSTALDDLEDGLTHDLELTNAIKQSWNETEKAQASYASSALENASELRNIEQGIWQLLGGQVDKRKELAAIAAEEAAKRRLALEQAVQAEQDLKAKADEAAADAAEKLNIKRQIKYETEVQLIKDREQLDILREQSNELKRFAEGKSYLSKINYKPLREFADEQFKKPGSYAGALGSVREKAGEMAKDPYFVSRLEGFQKRVDSMESALESLSGPGGSVARAEVAFEAAKTNAEDVAKAVEVSAAELEASFKKDEIKARFETAKQAVEQQATDITGILAQIETTNAQGAAAKEVLKTAAADGKIAADESFKVADSLKIIAGQIQAGTATTKGNVSEVLSMVRGIATEAARDAADIKKLKQDVTTLFSRVR